MGEMEIAYFSPEINKYLWDFFIFSGPDTRNHFTLITLVR
jgi:hypothetical protein